MLRAKKNIRINLILVWRVGDLKIHNPGLKPLSMHRSLSEISPGWGFLLVAPGFNRRTNLLVQDAPKKIKSIRHIFLAPTSRGRE
jgi:hypothetical protein